MRVWLFALLLAAATALPVPVSASPGGLDQNGCHVCHTNCQAYGLRDEEYHCHQPTIKISSAAVLKAAPPSREQGSRLDYIPGLVFITMIVGAIAVALRHAKRPLLRR